MLNARVSIEASSPKNGLVEQSLDGAGRKDHEGNARTPHSKSFPFGYQVGFPGNGDPASLGSATPTKEKDIVDSRALQHCRIDPLPNNASDYRAWKNSLYLIVAKLDISGSDNLSSWIGKAFKVGESDACSKSSELVPRPELLKSMKGVPELQFRIQGYIEGCTRDRGIEPFCQ